MSKQALTDQIAETVDGAELEQLDAAAQPTSDDDSFADIVSDIVEGDTTAGEVDDRVSAWLNDTFDIPFVPEAIEAKLFGLAVDAVKAAAVQTAKRLA
jgi:hypothetical protein